MGTENKPKTSNEPRRTIKYFSGVSKQRTPLTLLEPQIVRTQIPDKIIDLLAEDPLTPSPDSMHPSYGHIKTPIRFLLHNSSSNLSLERPYGGTPAQKSKLAKSQTSKKKFDFELSERPTRKNSAKQKLDKKLIPCQEIRLNFYKYT